MRDDVIGAFGDSALTGKPVGDDLREGKPTPLLARAVALAEPAELDVLARVGAPHLGDDEVAKIQQVIIDTGALDALEAHISTLAAEAVAALDHVAITDGARRAGGARRLRRRPRGLTPWPASSSSGPGSAGSPPPPISSVPATTSSSSSAATVPAAAPGSSSATGSGSTTGRPC